MILAHRNVLGGVNHDARHMRHDLCTYLTEWVDGTATLLLLVFLYVEVAMLVAVAVDDSELEVKTLQHVAYFV